MNRFFLQAQKKTYKRDQLVVGTVAMRGPDFGLSPPPLEQFEVACSVFQSAAETNSRAARALVHPQNFDIRLFDLRPLSTAGSTSHAP